MPTSRPGEIDLPGAPPDSREGACAVRHWVPGTFTLLAWTVVFLLFLEHVPQLSPLTGATWSEELIKNSLGCLLFAGLLPIYLKRDGLSVRDLGFATRPVKRDLVQGCAAGAIIQACSIVLLHFVGRGPEVNLALDFYSSTGAHVVAQLFSVVVLAPVAEEVFFRGCIIVPLRKCWGMGPRRDAVYALLSSIAFACGHYVGHPLYYIVYVLIGIAFACLYQRTGSLRTAIFAHAFMNASAMTLGAILR